MTLRGSTGFRFFGKVVEEDKELQRTETNLVVLLME
jgi:hypothetical protein